jgi:hypothetical protein
MNCLNDALIQAIADNEAPADARAHAASCETCARRVGERQAQLARLAAAFGDPRGMPEPLARRVERAVDEAAATPASAGGATRLRPSGPARDWRRTGWGTAALAAATLVVVMVIVPMMKTSTTVSAAEILARSASKLAETATSGIEIRQYELALDGVPREMMPDRENGTYRVWQAIDHDAPGRFRYASFAPGGRLLTSIAQNPAARTRTSAIRVDDQLYRFELTLPPGNLPSLPEIERLHMQASVMLMQASGQQVLQTIQDATGRHYRIEVPHVSAGSTNAVWDLTHALVLIDGADYSITEFTATGTFLKQPYSLSYKLVSHSVVSSVDPGTFDVPSEPGEIVIAGDGTSNPATDVFLSAMRELTRLKRMIGGGEK